MLVTLSPSKGQDFEIPMPSANYSVPAQLDQSQILINELLDYNPETIGSLMSISENLSLLNHQRILDFHTPFTPDNAKPALFAFKGDVYSGIESSTFSEADLTYAQDTCAFFQDCMVR